MSASGFKLAAQRKKAMSLVGALDSVALRKGTNPHADALKIVLLIDNEWRDNEKVWQALADQAQVNLPSVETRSIVRGIYEARAKAPVQEMAIQ